MTQEPRRKPRPSGDEGALLTGRIAAEVAGRRITLGWSAERLAEEMASAGVPWTRDVVVNLENGRRKSLAVHELLTLAWVLEVPTPLDLLVPAGHGLLATTFPVTPGVRLHPDVVRAWFKGDTGPLRRWLDFHDDTTSVVEEAIWQAAQETTMTDEHAQALIDLIKRLRPPGTWGLWTGRPEGHGLPEEDDTDGSQ